MKLNVLELFSDITGGGMSSPLIIYAHPNKEGHCGSILRNVEKNLASKNVAYKVIDLYAINYDPVLKPEEHYTSGHKGVSEQNINFQNEIKIAESIIFIYPTWWQNMPAILKGFVDRVFVAGFSYVYKNGRPVGLLTGKKSIIFTTTGASRLITKLFMKDTSTKVLAKYTLGFCGIKTNVFYLPEAQRYTSEKESLIHVLVEKGLASLK